MLFRSEESGRVYPYSDQANSVVDVLRFALEQPNIQLRLGAEVEKIRKTPSGFRLEFGEETLDCQRLITVTGIRIKSINPAWKIPSRRRSF